MTETIQHVAITESAFSSIEEVHDYIAQELQFPDYYGKNFSALYDCLTSRAIPIEIELIFDSGLYDEKFDKLCAVIMRAALNNETIGVRVHR